MTHYAVMDENTLIYMLPRSPYLAGVLAGSVLRGGHSWKNGVVAITGSRLRPATLADFEEYRVMPPPEMQVAA